MTLSEVAQALGVAAPAAERALSGVATDTRTLEPGALFFALRGPRHDAHDFVAEAERRGAAALVVERAVATSLPTLVLRDTRSALGRLAAAWRRRFTLPVVAITGSNGKTTVKTLVSALLAGAGRVVATPGNQNNLIGLPLSVLRLRAGHDYAVFELGTSAPGEIAALAAIAQPDVALVTGCAPAHLEGLASIDGVIEEKAALYRALATRGVAVVNLDDPASERLRAAAGERPVVTCAAVRDADVRVRDLGPLPQGRRLQVVVEGTVLECVVGLHGPHVASNVAAACAVARAVGVSPSSWPPALERVRPVAGRLSPRRGPAGSTVLDDCYNANPASLDAALAALAEYPGRRWLVLGDMAELGPFAAEAHREAATRARAAGIERLFTCGELAALTAQAFGAGAVHEDDHDALVALLRGALAADVTVLVKGSRSARLDRVVAGLIEEEAAPC